MKIKAEENKVSYKQKETSPNTVTNGKAVILVTSHFFSPHFSSNLLTLHAKMLVYMKISAFRPIANIPRYKGSLQEK